MPRLRHLIVPALVLAALLVPLALMVRGGGRTSPSASAGADGAVVRRVPTSRQPHRLPPDAGTTSAAPGAAARTEGERPMVDGAGIVAFREAASARFDEDVAGSQRRTAEDGFTREETRELTFFVHVVVRTQDWTEVAKGTGFVADDGQREAVAELASILGETRRELREQTERSAPLDGRLATIKAAEARYLTDYLRLTGMTAGQLDAFLASDYEVFQTRGSKGGR